MKTNTNNLKAQIVPEFFSSLMCDGFNAFNEQKFEAYRTFKIQIAY